MATALDASATDTAHLPTLVDQVESDTGRRPKRLLAEPATGPTTTLRIWRRGASAHAPAPVKQARPWTRRKSCTSRPPPSGAWLAEHHRRPTSVWLVQYKRRTGKPVIDDEDAVCEALRFGWIDSTCRRIDDEGGASWWSPRRKGSLWARTNKARVERLEAEGRMTDAGRAAIERAKADGIMDAPRAGRGPDRAEDLAAALDARLGARDRWDGFTASAQRAYLLWIYTAKRDTTRAKRVAETAECVAAGLRRE